MKNYYEILEVDQNASLEVIEKAYKVLAKKYHPDTQSADKKKWAEDKFKEIGEAYEILSNEVSRNDYNMELKSSLDDSSQEYEDLKAHNIELEKELSNLKNSYPNEYYDDSTDIEEQYEDVYRQAYVNVLRNMGYKIRERKDLKYYIKHILTLLLTIIILSIVLYVLWKIPYTNYYISSFFTFDNISILK